MKVAITLLAFVASVLALPAQVPVELDEIDWSKVEPLNIFVEPLVPSDVLPGGRIIGGAVAPRNSIPFQAALVINGASFCGGSLISSTWVLSAAHCTVSARTVQITLGAHNRNQRETTQIIAAATGVVNHNNYNVGGQFVNDISLLRINQIALTAAIQTVQLAAANAGNFAGSTARLSGWGRLNSGSTPAELHTVQLSILTNANCQAVFGSSSVIASSICTGGSRNGIAVGACNGDSGGPLTVNNVQVGVVSFGALGCTGGFPTVFARVSSFRSWIQSNSGV